MAEEPPSRQVSAPILRGVRPNQLPEVFHQGFA
jgi:hypothetical protein